MWEVLSYERSLLVNAADKPGFTAFLRTNDSAFVDDLNDFILQVRAKPMTCH